MPCGRMWSRSASPAAADINKYSKVLESLSDDISITYQQVDGRMGVSARDFVNARLKKVLPDGTIIVVRPRRAAAPGPGLSACLCLTAAAPCPAPPLHCATRCTTLWTTRTTARTSPCAGSTTTPATSSSPYVPDAFRGRAAYATWLTAAGGACGHGRGARQINESSCRVWWIIQTDIGGWVGFVNVRSITGQQMVQLLNNLKKYAEQA